MNWLQRNLQLRPHSRGFHLITDQIEAALPELRRMRVGLLHVFIQHTSASLAINENADADVPGDLESALSALAPEDFDYRHTVEGPDDMPAHVKSVLIGCFGLGSGAGGAFGPGNLARHLSVRTPQSGWRPPFGADAARSGVRAGEQREQVSRGSGVRAKS